MNASPPSSISISPCGPLDAVIRPPGSKSITNRALLCAAMARGESRLTGALDSEDTRVMLDCLRNLGIDFCTSKDGTVIDIKGCAGRIPNPAADLFVGNSGTTIRFLAATLAAAGGDYRLDGVPRMRERPIADLLEALFSMGADVSSEMQPGFPPVRIRSRGLRGGNVSVRGDVSSQFLSGLLMAAPFAQQDVELVVDGELVSQPYVAMTVQIMQAFGVEVHQPGSANWSQLEVPAPQTYQGREFTVEPDASAASYFWAAAAITAGKVEVEGLTFGALQGDVRFCECLERMGCKVLQRPQSILVEGAALHGVDVNMNDISDTVQTLSVVALFANGPTTIRGVAHIRHKETDRIKDLARELRRCGAEIHELPDGLRILPGPLQSAELNTYGDHRMAMSLALIGLRQPVVIRDPACVEKTYPRYFDDLKRVCSRGGRLTADG